MTLRFSKTGSCKFIKKLRNLDINYAYKPGVQPLLSVTQNPPVAVILVYHEGACSYAKQRMKEEANDPPRTPLSGRLDFVVVRISTSADARFHRLFFLHVYPQTYRRDCFL